MNFPDRPLIIVDVETTGLDPRIHDMIEIGAIRVGQDLEVGSEFEIKIGIQHPDTVTQEAIDVNGYKPEDWVGAKNLLTAMELFSGFAADGVLMSWNIMFDGGFIREGFRRTGLTNTLDYHTIDIPSIAWWMNPYRHKLSLSSVCEELGIEEEPKPHRAINGARKNLEVLQKLKEIYLGSIWRS